MVFTVAAVTSCKLAKLSLPRKSTDPIPDNSIKPMDCIPEDAGAVIIGTWVYPKPGSVIFTSSIWPNTPVLVDNDAIIEGFSIIILGIEEYLPLLVTIAFSTAPVVDLTVAVAVPSVTWNVLSIVIKGDPVYPLPGSLITNFVSTASKVTVPLAVEFPDASSYLYSLSYK